MAWYFYPRLCADIVKCCLRQSKEQVECVAWCFYSRLRADNVKSCEILSKELALCMTCYFYPPLRAVLVAIQDSQNNLKTTDSCVPEHGLLFLPLFQVQTMLNVV